MILITQNLKTIEYTCMIDIYLSLHKLPEVLGNI